MTIDITNSITLSSVLPAISLDAGVTLTIDGANGAANFAIGGGGSVRGLEVLGGLVQLTDLSLTHMTALGGSGKPGGGGGGGGLGAGSDIFVQTGGVLVIEGGTLGGGSASGGIGGKAGGGGTAGASGHGFGAGIFIQGATPTITLAPSAGHTIDVTDTITDQTGSDPTNTYKDPGSATVVVKGSGKVILGVANTYSGGTTLKSGVLELFVSGAVGSHPVTFAGTATLRLDGATLAGTELVQSFATTIDGIAKGNTIDLPNLSHTSGGKVHLDGTVHNRLDVVEGSDTVEVQLDPAQTLSHLTFTASPDAGTGTEVAVACYLAGTRIATPNGEVPVEALAVGDDVMTLAGETRPIRWIGHRSYAAASAAANPGLAPMRVCAGAFGARVPARDLFVSPDHAIWVGGVFIPARHLRYDFTICQEALAAVEYFHVELDRHEVLLAERLPAEILPRHRQSRLVLQ